MLKKCFCFLLIFMVIISSLVFPAFADNTSYSNTYFSLDNYMSLHVPSVAVDKDFIIVRETSKSGIFNTAEYRYRIYEFDKLDGVAEHVKSYFNLYQTDFYDWDYEALRADRWTNCGVFYDYLDLTDHGDLYTILYSTFDYTTADGSVIYSKSTPNENDAPGYEPDLNKITVVPERDWSNLLPSVMSAYGNRFDNWIVVRHPDTLQDDNIVVDGVPVYSSDLQWTYQLFFFSDDFEITWSGSSVGFDPHSLTYKSPYLTIKASTIHRYYLNSSYWDGITVLDSALEQANGDCNWFFDSTIEGSAGLNFGWFSYNRVIPYDHTFLSEALNKMFIASSASVLISSSDGWHYDPTGNYLDSVIEYSLPSVGWSKTIYSSFDDTGSDVVEPEEDDTLTWLERIYYAIREGFQSVLDKLSNLVGGESVSPDDPDLNEPIGGSDNDGDGKPDDGFSLIDIIKNISKAILKTLSGIFTVIADVFTDIVSSIGNFFSLITDSASGLFDFFDDDKGSFGEVNSFYGFLQGLWSCVPLPIQLFIYFSFGITLFFVLLKMFH